MRGLAWVAYGLTLLAAGLATAALAQGVSVPGVQTIRPLLHVGLRFPPAAAGGGNSGNSLTVDNTTVTADNSTITADHS